MTLVCIICLVVAGLMCSVAVCFQEKNKLLFLLLNIILSASLVCLSIVCASFQNFTTYGIIIIFSVLLGQANLTKNFFEVDFKNKAKENDENSENSQELQQNIEKNENIAPKTSKNAPKWVSWVVSGCMLVSAFLVAFSALYLGKETIYGFLIAIAFGALLTFLDAIIKKNPKFTSKTEGTLFYLKRLLIFTTAGLFFGQIIPVLMFSISIKNILFCVSLLLFAAYTLLGHFLPNKYNHLLSYAATLFLLSTLLI